MSINTTLSGLSQSAGSNGPDGASDPPSSLDDALRNQGAFIAQLRDGAHVVVTSVAGTNTVTGTVSTNPTAYVTGQAYRFIAAGANTGAVTLNLNSLGAKAVTKNGTKALVAGEIPSGAAVEVIYDGTQFQLVNVAQPAGLAGNGYQRLPSGLILQWGTSATSSGSVSVTFPLAFPNAALSVTATVNAASGTGAWGVVEVGATSTTAFTVYSSIYGTAAGGAANSTFGFNWMAIGW